MIFYTADLHFGHANIIKYCNRPFSSVQEMDEIMIANWNKVVGINDTVMVLGDFTFRQHESYARRLNGRKILIKGNHDRIRGRLQNFDEVWSVYEDNVNGQIIVLSHYAMRTWNKSFHGSWHLYGHSHGTLPEDEGMSFDVGVDVWNFYPVSFEVVRSKMKTKSLGNFANEQDKTRKANVERNKRFFKGL